VPLFNASFFVEKKREGNALILLTGSTHGRRFLEAQIHTHNYFLIFKGPSRPIYRYDIYTGHRPESKSARGQKSMAGGYPFHVSAIRDIDPSWDAAVAVVTSTLICYAHPRAVPSS
jgi:hypothetical protein